MSHSTTAGESTRSAADAHAGRHFLRHLGEMLVAMWAGMMVLGVFDSAILAIAGTSTSAVKDSAPEVVSIVMAVNMTAGMAAWMVHRRHSWARVADMGAAMLLPAVGAIVLYWCAILPAGAILGVQHAAMLPAMIGVMLMHRAEYSHPVHARAARQSS